MSFQEWYDRVFPELTQAGLWLRGGELNTLVPEEYERRSLRALFVRLSTYYDTGYSFTHQILYQIAANTADVFPDIAFLPPRGDANVFDRDQVPWLIGTQTKRGPESFDVIGFSNSIVQELINVPTFLKKSGIPLKKSERLERPELPLILLGGANALYSSSLWLDEALVDGVFVGESDQALRKILEICRDGKKAGLSKREVLTRLEEVPGFFQPESPRVTRKNFAMDLNRCEALEKAPIYYLEEPLGSSHLQISEGCPCFCSFCAETWERRPYRERSAATLREAAMKLKASMGLDTIEIYSFNFNLHSELYSILWDLAPNFRHIGLKSQRFDLLAHDPEALKFQHALEKTSLTCGLEGISPRIREYLHKNLESDELHSSLGSIFRGKVREMKVFLIATGQEEEQDFLALDDLLDHMQTIKRNSGAQTRVIFSMTPLVRFPWTPLEFEDAFPVGHYESIIRRTAGRVRAAGFEFREAADLPEYWVSQILVRADRPAVSRAMKRAVERTGFVYYREVSDGFMSALDQELRAEGLEPGALLKGFTLEESAAKPWAQISTGVKRDYLWSQFELARRFKQEDYCLGRSWVKAKCYHCGGCPTRFHVRNIVLSEQKRGYTIDQFRERRRKAQLEEKRCTFRVTVGKAARGLPRKMIGVALARALMLTEPALTPFYRGYAGAFWAHEDKPVWMTGEERLSLYFDQKAMPILQKLLANPPQMEKLQQEMGAWGRLLGFCDEAWQPKSIRATGSWTINPDLYLRNRGLKYTLRKQEGVVHVYELIPQSVKKGILKKLAIRKSDAGGFELELEMGPKFELSEFVSEVLLATKAAHPGKMTLEALV